ncbi:uncharacterized protein LOC143277929 [Babylonia areolata]|uniref:uncharacterized protein LOC143277929 n=1 Tax=Babylonia areolata TaxID=304850 RepID=UPI003FD4214B
MGRLAIALLSVLLLFSLVRGKDITFSANPSNVVNGTTKSLEINCKAPALDEKLNLIILLMVDQLEEGENVTIASDRGFGAKLHVQDSHMSVEGALRGADEAFLKVKIAEPELNHTGKYQCRFAYLNMAEFRFVLLSKTLEITFTEPDEPTPAPVVSDSCSCDQVWTELKDLRETLIAENRQLKDQLKSYDDSCRVSFTARLTGRNGKKFWSNRPMIFDSVLTNKGEAYNATEGIFTAPCSGQYFFRLTMRSHQDRDSGYVDGAIEVNGEEMARTSVFTDNPMDHYEQASNGLVLSLEENDEVQVRIQTNSAGKIYGEVFSVFSGFFISA